MVEGRADAAWLDVRQALVGAVRRGLITRKEVMAKLGVSASVFGGWCRAEQLREGRSVSPSGAGAGCGAFRRVALVKPRARPAVTDVVLRCGRRVRVAAGFDAAEVRRLVEALESC